MVDYHLQSTLTEPFLSNPLHSRDASGDESLFPASTLSPRSDYDSSSDVTSLLLTARSTTPTNLLEQSGFGLSGSYTNARESAGLGKWTKCSTLGKPSGASSRILGKESPWPQNFHLEQNSNTFTPTHFESVCSQISRTPSPGISKVLLSLSDHSLARPCTPNASTLYKNTKTHCNPSELGQQTYDECVFFTKWANTFLQQSQDQFLITDLGRDLGDGLTLLTLVEMLVGEYPPQIHIKPALDVQKMENVQTCLNFLEHYDVSINGIAAEDIVKGNLKVVLALCHSLYRHFASSTEKPPVYHLAEKDDMGLFAWVSKVTGKQVTGFHSFEDGTVLCLLLNSIIEDAVPKLVIEFGSPAEKVSLALNLSSEHLGIVTPLQADDIIIQRNQQKFLEYIKALYLVYSNKIKEVRSSYALEKSTLKREIKKLQLREQRLRDRHGSQLTYLGESSHDKSRITHEKLEGSLAELSRVISDIETLDNKRQEMDDLAQVSLLSDVMAHTETSDNSNGRLDELEKQLRLLELKSSAENPGFKLQWPDKLMYVTLQDNSSSRLGASDFLRKQTNPRQELRDVYRNTRPIDVTSGRKSLALVGRSDLVPSSRYGTFHSDRDDGGKLPFGGCYLSEPPSVFSGSRSRGLERDSLEESFVFKEYQVEPLFHNETKAFTPHTSYGAMAIPVNDTIQTSFLGETGTPTPQKISQSTVSIVDDHRLFPKSSMETKRVSKLFDVDFCDLHAKASRDQEGRALKRMIQAGNRSKLDRISTEGVNGEFSASRGTLNVYGKIGKAISTPTAKQQLNAVRRTPRYGSPSCPEMAANGAVDLNGRLTRDLSSSVDRGRSFTRDSRSRDDLVALQPAKMSQTNVNGGIANPLFGSCTMSENKEQLTTPFNFRPSGKPEDQHKGTWGSSSETFLKDSSESARSLKRSVSSEKRHRKQVLDKKSVRDAQRSSSKAHVHALTALIRMSAKNASASCSEEDN